MNKTSVLREELNMITVWKTEAWGTHDVPSFYCLPTATTKFFLKLQI
jgi:hypothetical protein